MILDLLQFIRLALVAAEDDKNNPGYEPIQTTDVSEKLRK